MKGVLVHGLLAVIGLTLAYGVWTGGDPAERPVEEVTVWDCPPTRLTSIRYEDKDRRVLVRTAEDEGDRYFWVETERLGTKAPGEGSEAAQKKIFVGSKALEEFVPKLLPFRAARSLGEIDGAMKKDIELDDPKGSLSIECGGRKRTFLVGGSAYGSGERYLQEKGGGPAYLVGAGLVGDLQFAQHRFMQRPLHRFEATEVDTLLVRAFGKERMLKQRNRQDKKTAEWVDAADPDRRNELYGNWMARVQRLLASEYLAPGAKPGSDLEGTPPAPVPVLTLAYRDDRGRELGAMELVRVDAEPKSYYARTEATRAWVKVPESVAREVDYDARPVVGLEPLPREEKPAPAPPEAQKPAEAPRADHHHFGH